MRGWWTIIQGRFLWQQWNESQVYTASKKPGGWCCDQVLSEYWRAGSKAWSLEMDCRVWFTAEREERPKEQEGGGGQWRWELQHHFSQQTKTFAGISIWCCAAVFSSCPIIHHLFELTTTWALHPHPLLHHATTHTRAHLDTHTLCCPPTLVVMHTATKEQPHAITNIHPQTHTWCNAMPFANRT